MNNYLFLVLWFIPLFTVSSLYIYHEDQLDYQAADLLSPILLIKFDLFWLICRLILTSLVSYSGRKFFPPWLKRSELLVDFSWLLLALSTCYLNSIIFNLDNNFLLYFFILTLLRAVWTFLRTVRFLRRKSIDFRYKHL